MIKIEIICGIYKILNKINGNFYIGSAKNINKRWNDHKNKLSKDRHENDYLQHAWNKYKRENFEFIIIKNCKPCNLLIIEQFYIDTLKPKYNMNLKTSGGNTMYNHPKYEEICKKISERMKGQGMGIKFSEERKSNMRKSWTETHQSLFSKVNQINKDTNEIIKVWDSMTEASIKLKGSRKYASDISRVCLGKNKTAMGYKWKYADKEYEKQMYVKLPKEIMDKINGIPKINIRLRKIKQINPITKEIIKIWDSIKSAAVAMNREKASSNIIIVLKNPEKNRTAFGFRWEYVETKTEPQINAAPLL